MLYESVHQRLRRVRGPASNNICSCGRQAQDWAYQHTGETKYSPDGKAYSEELDDYAAMCKSCHRKLDWATTPNRLSEASEKLSDWSREHSAFIGERGSEALAKWREENPEQYSRILSENQRRGRDTLRERWKSDPEFAARRKAEFKASQRRRRCSECQLESNPAGLGTHQKASGHRGYEEVPIEQKGSSK